MHQLRAVETQERFGFLLIDFQPMTDDVEIGIVKPVFFQRATLEALDEGIEIFTVQEKYRPHIQHSIEHLCLVQIARDAVQDEDIFLGMKPSDPFAVLDKIPPQLYRRLIRHELAVSGVFDENLRERIRRTE